MTFAACGAPPGRRGWECIAPANPGGGWDLTCRAVGAALDGLGLASGSVRVTNMPGAGGGVAFAHTITLRARDSALIVAASPSTTLRLAQRQYGRFSEHDVRWVAALGAEYGVLAVARDAQIQTLADVIAAWRSNASAVISGGGSAVAGQDHMKILLLAQRAGLDPRRIRYVPFDGGGEALTALLGGFIHLLSGDASEVEAQFEAGNVRVIAVLAPERLAGPLAGVPTAHEQGIPLDWITWRGFYAPGGISDAAYTRWVDALTRVAQSPEWMEARRRYGLAPYFVAGDEFRAEVEQQVEAFRAMSREIGLIR
ncbi:MAG TPA: tripartite tricarboxylate transporter substrate-binding protein [Gemmatimonadales bacterium]|nr:tripartite tricarboxylate transporter substrate-binding protein [Gemmatimonadales bacterium]